VLLGLLPGLQLVPDPRAEGAVKCWFYSDPHFGHANVIKYSNRPFATVEEMDQELLRRYQAVVKPEDIVVWLGDCFFGPFTSRVTELMGQLPGRKILVRGNHDRSASRMAAAGFDFVTEELRMHIAGRPVRLRHFPYAGESSAEEDASRDHDWADKFKSLRPPRVQGEVLLHGHTHKPQRRSGNMVHVGVDAWGYAPASYEEIEALVEEVFR
jgi:calcineurin-like phosphoesterase family protein